MPRERFALRFDFRSYLTERQKFVERALGRAVPEPGSGARVLFEAMRYSLLSGGKRIRPVMALAACEAVGGAAQDALGLACALEMIHTYSMVHDDLPCMDDDELRRGKPTNHRVYGDAMATLAGDALLTDAFYVLASWSTSRVPAEVVLRVIAELARAAGSTGMVAGQAADIESEGRALNREQLEHLHGRKTGALFMAAVRGGASLGGGRDSELEALTAYARAAGLAFQVTDDILDVESSADRMGKRTQKDGGRGKATYPGVLGLERSREFAQQLKQRAIETLDGFGESADALRALACYVVEREA